jgi:hypothetical protein
VAAVSPDSRAVLDRGLSGRRVALASVVTPT